MKEKLKVYYDGQCPLCSREIDHYRNKDTYQRLSFIDITQASFNAELEGLDPKKIHSVFHIKTPTNKVLTGVDGFVAIWNELEIWRPMAIAATSKLGAPIFKWVYSLFAMARPYLPKKDCKEGSCQV